MLFQENIIDETNKDIVRFEFVKNSISLINQKLKNL